MAVDAGALLRLISESTRHAILARLRQSEATVGQLVTALRDEQSNISHHLALLREAGLVVAQRSGRTQRYRLSDPEVARLLDQVQAVAAGLDRVGYSAILGLPTRPGFAGYG